METRFILDLTPERATLAIDGVLDLAARGQLGWRLLDLERVARRRVRLDLGGITHVDTACLRLIDDARMRLQASGRDFALTSASLAFALVSELSGYRVLARASRECRSRAPGTSGARLVQSPRTRA